MYMANEEKVINIFILFTVNVRAAHVEGRATSCLVGPGMQALLRYPQVYIHNLNNGPVHKRANHVPKAVLDRNSNPFLI